MSLLIYFFLSVGYCSAAAAEKRQADEPLSSAVEEPRKKKIDGDVPSDVVAEIVEVTSDPKKMLGPDVSVFQYNKQKTNLFYGFYSKSFTLHIHIINFIS